MQTPAIDFYRQSPFSTLPLRKTIRQRPCRNKLNSPCRAGAVETGGYSAHPVNANGSWWEVHAAEEGLEPGVGVDFFL